jgi:hypothetical protein
MKKAAMQYLVTKDLAPLISMALNYYPIEAFINK